MKVKVRASVIVEIDLPDEWDKGQILFHVEMNGCPGVHEVGSKIEEEMTGSKLAGVCWACNLEGDNKVLEIDGKPVVEAPPNETRPIG